MVYGGGGLVGGAVASAFAREGARVFLAGRTLATLDEVAEEISASSCEELTEHYTRGFDHLTERRKTTG